MIPAVRGLARRVPPERRDEVRLHLRRLRRPARLAGLLSDPVSDRFGSDRGTVVDRVYIEQFLERHRADVHGRVLEVKDAAYTRRFGAGVTGSDVLDVDPANPDATIVADLAAADVVASDRYDCFILTQTLLLIYDVHEAVRHAHRVLRPGGVLLVTVPALSRLCPEPLVDYWRFTVASCERLFGDRFGHERVDVEARGNLRTATAFLAGVAAEELPRRVLARDDPRFPVIVTVRAVKG